MNCPDAVIFLFFLMPTFKSKHVGPPKCQQNITSEIISHHHDKKYIKSFNNKSIMLGEKISK